MYKLDAVNSKELELNHFYIRKVNKGGLVLSIYLGKSKYGTVVRYYFYDCVGLIGKEEEGIYDTQCWELDKEIEWVFSRKLEESCFKSFTNALIGVYRAPRQYQLKIDVMQWYDKNRLLNPNLVEINVILGIEEKDYLKLEDLQVGEVYLSNTNKIEYYMGKNLKEGYKKDTYYFMELDINNRMVRLLNSLTVSKIPKIVTLEKGLQKKMLTEEQYQMVKTTDIEGYVRNWIS